jgi:hypothetical protein
MWALRPFGDKVSQRLCGKKWHKALCVRVFIRTRLADLTSICLHPFVL